MAIDSLKAIGIIRLSVGATFWAKIMIQVEKIEVKTSIVSCDGGEPPLGHPMVYLKIKTKKNIAGGDAICPYCSRHFVVK